MECRLLEATSETEHNKTNRTITNTRNEGSSDSDLAFQMDIMKAEHKFTISEIEGRYIVQLNKLKRENAEILKRQHENNDEVFSKEFQRIKTEHAEAIEHMKKEIQKLWSKKSQEKESTRVNREKQ
eukprot:UN33044